VLCRKQEVGHDHERIVEKLRERIGDL